MTWAHALALLLGVVQHRLHPPQPHEVRDGGILPDLPPLHHLGHPLDLRGHPCHSSIQSVPHHQNAARRHPNPNMPLQGGPRQWLPMAHLGQGALTGWPATPPTSSLVRGAITSIPFLHPDNKKCPVVVPSRSNLLSASTEQIAQC